MTKSATSDVDARCEHALRPTLADFFFFLIIGASLFLAMDPLFGLKQLFDETLMSEDSAAEAFLLWLLDPTQVHSVLVQRASVGFRS